MKKQLMALILIIAAFMCLATVCSADTQKEISLYVNGKKIHSEVPPQIINGTTLVPLRVIFEALGATVEWDNATKTVSSTLGEESIKLTIGESSLYKNDTAITLSVPAQIIDGRTMVPVRAISESYGFFVSWYGEIRTVSINESKRVELIPYYNADGQKVTIEKALSKEYDDLGWNSDINKIENKVTMYAADGRTISVVKTQIDDYKAVGWYTEPVVLMYADDGRTLYVEQSKVEAHKKVGWRTEKPTIHPTAVYTSANVELSVGSKSKLTCSFKPENTTETSVTWTSDNTTVATIEQDGTVSALSIGNANITATTENGLKTSCMVSVVDLKYDESKVGSMTGTITWQYNDFIGTKPDVGAKLLLIQVNHKPTDKDHATIAVMSDSYDNLVYRAEVDGTGNFYFDNIPAGEYFLIVSSKNTNMSPRLRDVYCTEADKMLKGVISDEALESLHLKIKINSFDIKKITIRENQITRYSKDWGNTYS